MCECRSLPGQHPLAAKRINYFNSPKFEGCFDPHPEHPRPLTLAELAIRNARRAQQLLQSKKEIKAEPKRAKGFFKSLVHYLTVEHIERGRLVFVGLVALGIVVAKVFWPEPKPAPLGPAVVDYAPQLNLRTCAAANCAIVTTLNKGDPVTVTKSYDNGWKGVTIRYTDGTSAKGFVNGDFLRQQ